MITRDSINSEIEFYKVFRKQLADRLRNLPAGKLYYKMCNGRRRPFVMENGTEKYLSQKYIKRIAGLQNRREIEQCLRKLDTNLEILETINSNFFDFEAVVPSFVDVPSVGSCEGRKAQTEIAAIMDRWAEVSGGHPYHKGNFIASDKTALKSRVEMILHEHFLSLDLCFAYERMLLIDGEEWYPDFSFIRESDGQMILWEHFGMMNDPQYFNTALYKQDKYASSGFLPYKNIVYTYDFGNDSIDLLYVRQLLELMQLL